MFIRGHPQSRTRVLLSLTIVVFAYLLCCALAFAQTTVSSSGQTPSATITAVASADRVRITAPMSVVQMRVEVYDGNGIKVWDSEIRGNVFDWHVQDGQAQRPTAGDYACVVTVKNVAGRLTQKIGSIRVGEKDVHVALVETGQLSAPQSQAIGPVEEDALWTILADDQNPTATVIAHDGKDGQMIRGRGALTFRIGNFFTGRDQEQMRLTEEGNLGIGTSVPRATLDVAGTIRAQRIMIAKPIKTQPGISATDTLTADPDDFEPLASGTGTQDRIAKWIDGSGTLGDSSITETSGNVGIGTTAPGSKLVVSANSSTLPPASGIARFADADGVQTAVFADSFGTNPIFNVRRANGTAASPSAVQADQLLGVIGASGYGASAYMGTRARVGFFASENWTNTANGTYLTFNTTANGAATPGGSERMRIDKNGNVGIGTTVPNGRLSIAGSPFWTSHFWGGAVEMENASAIGWRPNTSGWRFGVGRTNDGFVMFRTDVDIGTTSGVPPLYDFKIDNSGNVGIGNSTLNMPLNAKLSVLTPAPDYGFQYAGGTATVAVLTGSRNAIPPDIPAVPLGGWLGTRTNHPLYFFANDARPTMTVATDGNIGIGTTNPLSKLDVRGNVLLDTGTNPLLYLSSADTEQNRYLQVINSPSFQSASGLKAGGILVADQYDYANPGKNDLVVKGNVAVGGNVAQGRDKGGFVKAMLYVNGDGTLLRCYNGLTGASLTGGTTFTGCGFSISRGSPGFYHVDFNFQVDDRFISVSVNNIAAAQTGGPYAGVSFIFATTEIVSVEINEDNSADSDRPFMIIVF